MDYVTLAASKAPEHAPKIIEVGRLFQKKLWFQLSGKLLELVTLDYYKEEDRILTLYNNFVSKFAKKINQLALVQIAIAASKQLPDVTASLGFLEGICKLVDGEEQPSVLCRMEMARCQLRAGKLEDAKVLLDDGKKRMDDFMGIMDAEIHSHYYHASMLYSQAKISPKEQLEFAKDVSLAALLGDSIYNFGELLQQPVLKVLGSSSHEYAWLPELLLVFNRGDVTKFSSLVAEKKTFQPILAKHGDFLREKIRIMAFMDMVLGRDGEKRKLEFKDIAQRCDTKLLEVELMVMRAFSLKVARGVIDQVDQVVTVKWVQPRVLEKQQISLIRDRLKNWAKQIDETARYLETNAPELL